MPALLVVRAVVPEAERAAFDRWYADEHLPDAHAAFSAEESWRGWSDDADPEAPVHLAFYRFPDAARARAIPDSDAMAEMRRRFDAAFPDVARSRFVIDLAQRLA